jgi:hypothetical protein
MSGEELRFEDIGGGVDIPIDVIHADLGTFRSDDIDPAEVFPQVEIDIDSLLNGFQNWIESEGHATSTSSTYRRAVKHYLWVVQHDPDGTVISI